MKKVLLTIAALFLVLFTIDAYSLNNFNYTGIAFDGSGTILANTTVGVHIELIDGGLQKYYEEHSGVSTDQFGVYTVEVGTGTHKSGNLTTTLATKTMKIKSTVTGVTGTGVWVVSSLLKLNTAVTGGGIKADLTDGNGIADFTYDGSSAVSIDIDNAYANHWTVDQYFENILPEADTIYALGDDTHRWRDLYLSGKSLHIGVSGNEATLQFIDSLFTFIITSPATVVASEAFAVTGDTYLGDEPTDWITISGEIWAPTGDVLHVASDIVPEQTLDIGSTTKPWGEVYANAFHGNLHGIATTAIALQTARNFSVSGDVSTAAAVSFDGSSNVNLAVSFASGVIVNEDVNASAAIAGTKISPDFGSQNVTTSGNISTTGTGGLTVAGNATVNGGTLTINDVLKLTPRATAPSSPTNGTIYYNSTDNKLYLYANGAWVALN